MLILGIDTGGTYTDGVIMNRETREVLHTAKALTTHEDLPRGIENCIQSLGFDKWSQIGMVSLSTTLATNTIVEGKGGRVGLLLIGDRPEGEIPADCCVEIEGKIDIRGGISQPLNRVQCREAIQKMQGKCDAVAVSGYASVRNPLMENQAARMVSEILHLPVVCAHELTGRLGFYERTVTAVLNARLLPLIQNLIQSVHVVLEKRAVTAPVMIVRGDGSLMKTDYAAKRPVETILSGPAASVIGASFLSGKKDGMIIDMGGTTTDIAFLENGQCAVAESGADLAGWKTCVKALDICTFGLGGDSEIHKDSEGNIQIGPRRVIPFCRDGQTGRSTGLTPTDLLHVTGEYTQWNQERAAEGIKQMFLGAETARVAADLEEKVSERLKDCCQAGMKLCGKEKTGLIIGVGAPSEVWVRKAAWKMMMPSKIPPYASVANAVGAAAAKVRESSEALVRKNKINNLYYIYTEKKRYQNLSLEDALITARNFIVNHAADKARMAGAEQTEIKVTECEKKCQNDEFIEYRLSARAIGYPFYST